MAQLTNEDLNFMLGATGYLPPRSEEEHLFFEQMYGGYVPKTKGMHVDVDGIVNGKCNLYDMENHNEISLVAEDTSRYNKMNHSMAARNFDKLPQSVIDKIRNQHKSKKDET